MNFLRQVCRKSSYYSLRMRAFSYRRHFRSRDKDGGHTIRSVIAENHMIHANLMTLSFIGVMGDRSFYSAGIWIFLLFAPVTLT